jgi:hypothetical protein
VYSDGGSYRYSDTDVQIVCEVSLRIAGVEQFYRVKRMIRVTEYFVPLPFQ